MLGGLMVRLLAETGDAEALAQRHRPSRYSRIASRRALGVMPMVMIASVSRATRAAAATVSLEARDIVDARIGRQHDHEFVGIRVCDGRDGGGNRRRGVADAGFEHQHARFHRRAGDFPFQRLAER
jgi:hypothetical protein